MAAALLASGCSTVRFAYENADAYLRWKAGTYVDLQAEEADELDDRIEELHAWQLVLPRTAAISHLTAAELRGW